MIEIVLNNLLHGLIKPWNKYTKGKAMMIRVLVGQHFGALKCHQNRVGREEMRGGGTSSGSVSRGLGNIAAQGE